MSPILEWGIPVISWLQGLGAWLTPIMQAFTFLGDEQFYLLILPILLWWIDIGIGIRIGIALLLSAGLNGGLKLVFGTPRPYWVSSQVKALSSGTTYGIPSGHAQNAVVLWGRLAVWTKPTWVKWVLGILILLIGVSRSYLAVHFPTDVLAGWAIGLLLLWLLVVLDEPVRKRLARMNLTGRMGMVFLLSLLVIAVGAVAFLATANRILPETWITRAAVALPGADPIDPQSMSDSITAAGTLLGLGIGGVLLLDWGKFQPRARFWVLLIRYGVGIAGLLGIYLGLSAVFPAGHTLLAYSLRYIRYATLGLWVAYLAPRLFVLLRLS
jgi:membrane-associated phospholipid phosphatase